MYTSCAGVPCVVNHVAVRLAFHMQETNGHATQMEQAQAACQLQSAQQRLADAETAAADAEQKLRQTQTEHTSHLRQVAEQHSSLLRDVESSHETQLKARLKKLSQQHSEALSQMQGSHEAQAKLAQQHHEVWLNVLACRCEIAVMLLASFAGPQSAVFSLGIHNNATIPVCVPHSCCMNPTAVQIAQIAACGLA